MNRLGYEFAPIDVSITTHPKAYAAGVEAMGLWLWGVAFAKQHNTGGRLPRAVVLAAWGGKRNAVLAKRLVDAGLWILRDDGDWDIHNYAKKGPERAPKEITPGAERMRRFREKRRSDPPPSMASPVTGCDASHVTESDVSGDANSDRNGDASHVTSRSTSSDLKSSDLKSSDLGSLSPASKADPDLPASVSMRAREPAGPPSWFTDDAVDTIEMLTPDVFRALCKLNLNELWLQYLGTLGRQPGRQGNAQDAQSWLVKVVRGHMTDDAARAKREAEIAKRYAPAPGSQETPKLTPEQAQRDAKRFGEMLKARQAAEAAKETGT